MKNLLLLMTISLFSLKGFTQLSVSFYNSGNNKIGLGYNFEPKVWTELRLYQGTFIDDVTPEFVFCYNFVSKENHNVYAGIGGVVNVYNGFVLPIGVQFTPIEQFKNFSLHMELQPTLDFDTDLFVQASWGIRYTFGTSE